MVCSIIPQFYNIKKVELTFINLLLHTRYSLHHFHVFSKARLYIVKIRYKKTRVSYHCFFYLNSTTTNKNHTLLGNHSFPVTQKVPLNQINCFLLLKLYITSSIPLSHCFQVTGKHEDYQSKYLCMPNIKILFLHKG